MYLYFSIPKKFHVKEVMRIEIDIINLLLKRDFLFTF